MRPLPAPSWQWTRRSLTYPVCTFSPYRRSDDPAGLVLTDFCGTGVWRHLGGVLFAPY